MRSREDLVAKVREALRHPKAVFLFEIGLGQPTPNQAARVARNMGLANEEEKLAKKVAVFKRDYGQGWFKALREILENPEGESTEMGLTKTQRRTLENIKLEDIKEAIGILENHISEPTFDPRKIKEEHLQKIIYASNIPFTGSHNYSDVTENIFGMSYEEALNCIPIPEEGRENYLLVVNCLPLAKLMRFIEVDGKRGKSFLFIESKIEDKVEVPRALFYWRYDIENGKATLGLKPVDAEERLRKENRQGLTVREEICLAIQNPEILKDHTIWCVGSRYVDYVPYLFLDVGQPKLFWNYADIGDSCWGAASCLRRP